MTKQKILLAYITHYSGHHQASLAIEKALGKLSSRIEVFKIDFLKYLHPFGGLILERVYRQMLEKNPKTWEYLYDNPRVYAKLSKWVDWLVAFKSFKLTKLVKNFDPDIICCTQAFPALMMADFKGQKQSSLKMALKMALTSIVGVFTDYSPHWYWLHPNIDHYVVPSLEIAEALAARGVERSKIKDFGIPIDPKFLTERINKKEVLGKLGLNDFLPVVLVMGGGRGIGPIKEVIEGLDSFSSLFQLVVVCGRNQKLQEEIKKKLPFLHYPVKILGYVENINELMKVSSLIITKPGGLTISECLACNLPMIMVNPVPGQESLNAQFLLKHNLAVTAANGGEAAQAALKLLNDHETRKQMSLRAKEFAKPDAALAIAYALIKGWD